MNVFVFLMVVIAVFNCVHGKNVVIDENSVCQAKLYCSDCLQLIHCQWCESKNSCFSPKLYSDFCLDTPIVYEDKNLSIALNVECACAGGKMDDEPCKVKDADENIMICSGRGECVCGRCSCNTPDPEHPTKVIMGEFCEVDNFSEE